MDSQQSYLTAETLTNVGRGQLYADRLILRTRTLNNLAEDGVAATLAGRERLDIGTTTLNNRDHALIYSGGTLALGGGLAAAGQALGRAQVVNNYSATLESAGALYLGAERLANVNDHFSLTRVPISSTQILEYQHRGDPQRWQAGTPGVFIDRKSADKLLNLNTPSNARHNNDDLHEYRYTQRIRRVVFRRAIRASCWRTGDYLLETAPRFTQRKPWLGTTGARTKEIRAPKAAGAGYYALPSASQWVAAR